MRKNKDDRQKAGRIYSSLVTILRGIMNPKYAKEIPSGKRIVQPLTEKQLLAPQRAGYYETVWPSEHTDLWRSHAVSDVGLPADFDPPRLTVTSARLNLPVWGYTRAKNEVFAIGGSPATLNIFTQTIKNGGTAGTEKTAIASRLVGAGQPYQRRGI